MPWAPRIDARFICLEAHLAPGAAIMRLPGIRVFVKPFPLSNLEWQSFSEDQLVDRPAK